MSDSPNIDAQNVEHDHQRNTKIASRSFWATVILLAVVTLGLTVGGRINSTKPLEFSPTTLERLLSDTAKAAKTAVEPDVDALLDAVYAPVYEAIPEYATFHYSVIGEYTELGAAFSSDIADSLNDRLFAGFDQRLSNGVSDLDQMYAKAYQSILEEQVADKQRVDGEKEPLGELTEAVLQDAVIRAKTTKPINAVAATVAGTGVLKVFSKKIATKLATKITTKVSVKGGSVLVAGGGGALLCAWSGPGAVVCGAAGAAAAWLITDAAVVNIDEYFNREEFESDLRAMLDEDRAEKRTLLIAALDQKAAAMDAAAKEIFRLRDLSSDE